MKSFVSKTAAILSACCIFSAFAASCSDNKGKKENESEKEPEKSYTVSPEDFSSVVFSGIGNDGLYEEFDTLFSAANAEDPFVSNLGYMVDDDVLNISWLGNDDPIKSFDHMLSSATGNTPDYEDNFEPKPYFKGMKKEIDYNKEIVSREDYGEQYLFRCREGSGDAYVDVRLVMPETGRLCFNIGAENYSQCNVWLSDTKDGDEFIDFSSLGTYGGDGKGHAVDAGTFNKGEDVSVRFSILPENGMEYSGEEYFMVRKESGFNFYYADETAIKDDLEQFTAQPFVLDEKRSDYEKLTGTVTAEDGKILMTSLPYDTEHEISVDGRKFDSLVEENLDNGEGDQGEVVVFGKFIGMKLPEGEHKIEIRFTEKYDEEEYKSAADFAELIFADGETEERLKTMFPSSLLSEADEKELTDFFSYASASFGDMYPGCKLISKNFRRLRDADEMESSGFKSFYDSAYEHFGLNHDEVEVKDAAIYQLILEYENESGETERAYQLYLVSRVDGEWCAFFC